jgi:hypothetical protein
MKRPEKKSCPFRILKVYSRVSIDHALIPLKELLKTFLERKDPERRKRCKGIE